MYKQRYLRPLQSVDSKLTSGFDPGSEPQPEEKIMGISAATQELSGFSELFRVSKGGRKVRR